MDTFNVSQWFKTRSSLNIQLFKVDGVEFELMALSAEQLDEVLMCDTYDQALMKSANYGISYDRKRVSDDKELAKDLGMLWELEEVNTESDPCMQFRIGEKVCEISGIKSEVDEMLANEKLAAEKAIMDELAKIELANAVDGDNLNDIENVESVTMGEMVDDAESYLSHQQ